MPFHRIVHYHTIKNILKSDKNIDIDSYLLTSDKLSDRIGLNITTADRNDKYRIFNKKYDFKENEK